MDTTTAKKTCAPHRDMEKFFGRGMTACGKSVRGSMVLTDKPTCPRCNNPEQSTR